MNYKWRTKTGDILPYCQGQADRYVGEEDQGGKKEATKRNINAVK